MTVDLPGDRDGISERFAPEKDSGRLIEAEHVARYRWAAQAVQGRDVLDAGCGTAYGTKLLAEAGARHVTGVDLAAGVLAAVRPKMPANVTLEAADLNSLPFPDSSFSAVVCFEVLEHFEDPFPALDELARVLADDGLLLVSSPNRGVFPAGNPHHHHEFEPQELHEALSERFGHVRLVRQQDYLLSAALTDDSFTTAGDRLPDLLVDKLVHDEPGRELYTLGLASNSALPDLPELGVLTGTLEFREWLDVFAVQTQAITDKDNYIGEIEDKLAERDRLAALLAEAEQSLAEIPALKLEIEDLRFQLAGVRGAEEAAREQVRQLEDRLTESRRELVSLYTSPSWRLTKPLRFGKRLYLLARRVAARLRQG